MKLIITIDTEEDNWGKYSRGDYTVENIFRIPSLQKVFDDFNVKPTYLITYPVATNDRSFSILNEIYKQGNCEIGTHCHPWNTPPYEEPTTARNSMMCNLPEDLQYRKMKCLHEIITSNFGIKPTSFRAGRWGYSREVARCLHKLGYKIDTSITPYTDWREDYGPDFSNMSPQPFRYYANHPFQRSQDGHLIEVPATIGYLQHNFALSNRIAQMLRSKPINALRLDSVLHKMNVVNRAWLSPETTTSTTMIRLAKRMMANRFTLINLFFHSPSLQHGRTPFVQTKDDEMSFLNRIKDFLTFVRETGIESIRLSDAGDLV